MLAGVSAFSRVGFKVGLSGLMLRDIAPSHRTIIEKGDR